MAVVERSGLSGIAEGTGIEASCFGRDVVGYRYFRGAGSEGSEENSRAQGVQSDDRGSRLLSPYPYEGECC